MEKYLDPYSVPSNDRAISKRAEQRHRKRYSRANNGVRSAGLAFAWMGAWLKVSNDGHHWQIVFPTGSIIRRRPNVTNVESGTKRNLKCKRCDRKFKSEQALKDHNRDVHRKRVDIPEVGKVGARAALEGLEDLSDGAYFAMAAHMGLRMEDLGTVTKRS